MKRIGALPAWQRVLQAHVSCPLLFSEKASLKIHWSTFATVSLLAFYLRFGPPCLDWSISILGALFLLLALLLHEFGHAFVYHGLGCGVKTVRIWVLGGDTESSVPPSYAGEALASICGPLLNLFTAALCYAAGVLFKFHNGNLVAIYPNLIMGAITIIPLFPLDGGRVIRSLLCLCVSPTISLWIVSTVSVSVGVALIIAPCVTSLLPLPAPAIIASGYLIIIFVLIEGHSFQAASTRPALPIRIEDDPSTSPSHRGTVYSQYSSRRGTQYEPNNADEDESRLAVPIFTPTVEYGSRYFSPPKQYGRDGDDCACHVDYLDLAGEPSRDVKTPSHVIVRADRDPIGYDRDVTLRLLESASTEALLANHVAHVTRDADPLAPPLAVVHVTGDVSSQRQRDASSDISSEAGWSIRSSSQLLDSGYPVNDYITADSHVASHVAEPGGYDRGSHVTAQASNGSLHHVTTHSSDTSSDAASRGRTSAKGSFVPTLSIGDVTPLGHVSGHVAKGSFTLRPNGSTSDTGDPTRGHVTEDDHVADGQQQPGPFLMTRTLSRISASSDKARASPVTMGKFLNTDPSSLNAQL